MDVSSIIKSRDVRDHIRQTGYQLPDRDAATILFNAGFSHKRLTRMLKELAEETEDEPLRQEIKERLAFDERCFFLFQQNDGNYFFQVRENAPAFTEPSGNFASLETALSYAKSHDTLFDIAKYEIVKELSTAKKPVVHTNPRLKGDKPAEEIPYCGASVAEYTYNEDGSIISYWSEECSQEEWDAVNDWGVSRFERRFVPFPNPFNEGDIVSFVGGTLPGIVSTSQKEWSSLVAEAEAPSSVLDFADASICVQFYSKSTGHFEYSHVHPIYLERLELDAEEEAELRKAYSKERLNDKN